MAVASLPEGEGPARFSPAAVKDWAPRRKSVSNACERCRRRKVAAYLFCPSVHFLTWPRSGAMGILRVQLVKDSRYNVRRSAFTALDVHMWLTW